jgi:hypothetical protein
MTRATHARHDKASSRLNPGDCDFVGNDVGNAVGVGVSFRELRSFDVLL